MAHALAHRPDTSVACTARFSVVLKGSGTIELMFRAVPADEYARIDFDCMSPGTLRVTVDDKVVFEAKASYGGATVTGLFFHEGARIRIMFDAWYAYGEQIAGSVSITPAQDEAVAAALRLFNLPKDYSEEQLAKAYKKLVARWHPDKEGGDNTKLREINYLRGLLRDRLERGK